MNKAEQIAFQYLIDEKGYKQDEIDFSAQRSVDFICKNGERIEVKLTLGKVIYFTTNQRADFIDTPVKIIVVKNDKVIDFFPYDELEERGYKSKARYIDSVMARFTLQQKKNLELAAEFYGVKPATLCRNWLVHRLKEAQQDPHFKNWKERRDDADT